MARMVIMFLNLPSNFRTRQDARSKRNPNKPEGFRMVFSHRPCSLFNIMKLHPRNTTTALGIASVTASCAALAASVSTFPPAVARPNIVYVLADDLGYGDLQCFNPNGKIKTPRADRLAAQGMKFTDAHSTSAVCSPTRYAILTGRYNWRSTLQRGVLGGFSAPLIRESQPTVGKLLQKNGYATACIGKWHLGIDWPLIPGAGGIANSESIDFSKSFRNGPTMRGFDYFFGISASLDMPPYVFLENDRVAEPVTRQITTQNRSSPQTRPGPLGATFEAGRCLPDLTERAVKYIEEQAKSPERKPFFLYFPLTSPHTPIVPDKAFQGRSGINAYADFVMATDWALGQVLDALERCGIAENTIVIFTSDNGYAPYADYETLRKAGHEPSAQFRGWKADIWDGGHRVPFIVRWPARVKPGTTCADPVTLADFMATCADILGVAQTLPPGAAVDSVSILPDLLQTASAPVHEAIVHHSIGGKFSIRQGNWKLELCPGSGGWAAPRDPAAAEMGLPSVQLYDLSTDIGEQKNLVAQRPDIVERLTKLIEKYVEDGRTTPGPKQPNDVQIDIFKPTQPAVGSTAKQNQ